MPIMRKTKKVSSLINSEADSNSRLDGNVPLWLVHVGLRLDLDGIEVE